MTRDKNKGVEETRDGQKIGQQDARQKKWGDKMRDEKKMGR